MYTLLLVYEIVDKKIENKGVLVEASNRVKQSVLMCSDAPPLMASGQT